MRLWRALPLGLRRRSPAALAKGRARRAAAGASRAAAAARRRARAVHRRAARLARAGAVRRDARPPKPLHALEHSLFFAVAVLFFKQLIPSPPLRAPLGDASACSTRSPAMTVSWVLAVALALAPSPLYSHYAHLASRPGGIRALADQQLAAGIMWVPGSITFLILILSTSTAGSHRRRQRRTRRLASGH